jgi:hypothetical protein
MCNDLKCMLKSGVDAATLKALLHAVGGWVGGGGGRVCVCVCVVACYL